MEHKTKEQLNKLNDKRLLSYYKSVRAKTGKYIKQFYCDCCGTPDWEFTNSRETKEEREIYKNECLVKIKKAENYLSLIKAELSKRKHVEK